MSYTRVPRFLRIFVLGGIVGVCWSSLGWSQTTSATISGTVTDQGGAAVPNADVTLTNEGTAVETTTKSNEVGSFTMAGLPVGTYTVTISREGFQTYKESRIYIGPAQTRSITAVLMVGGVSSEVTVTASLTQVQTTTSELSNHVAEEQVATLPLNGRNYQGLSALMPGVVNTDAGSALGTGGRVTRNSMSINGMGTSNSYYTVDGVWNMNTGNMAQTTILPNPDQIQEVRVLQNNYSPKDSLMGASVVMVETRSGTRNVHGSIFEYFRNDALDARNFFSPTVPSLKQNIFGGTIGGPFVIPGKYNTNKDKTFFFGSIQGVFKNSASVLRGATPTAAVRQGIFSNKITDPNTGQPFSQDANGNFVIPSGRLNLNSLALMKAMAELPNNPAGGFLNFINLKPETLRQEDFQIKVDHNFSHKVRLTTEYFDTRQWFTLASVSGISGANSPFNTNFEKDLTRNKLAQIKLTTIISPSIVNQVSFGMNNYVLDLLLQGKTLLPDVPDFRSVKPFNGFGSDRLPLISFARGWAGFGDPRSRPLAHAGDLEDMVSDDWSWMRANHFLQVGINVVKSTKRQDAFAASQGEWLFSGKFTKDPIADYLLGLGDSFFQQSTERRPYIRGTIASPYFQDTWKVNRRLTLNYGVRWSFMPLPHPQRAFETLFDSQKFDPAKAPIVNPDGTITPTPNFDPLNGLIRNGVNGVPDNFSNRTQWYWQPSVGIAYDVFGDGKTALRGGYGLTTTRVFTGSDCSYNCGSNPPEVQSITIQNPLFPNPVGTGTTRPPGAPTLNSADLRLQAAQIQSFSLTVEHEFPGNWIISIGGAGNIARHLASPWNRNQPFPSSGFDFDPSINSGVFQGVFAPFKGYHTISTTVSEGNTYWDALEISARHPVGKNLFLTAAYTWSHALTDVRSGGVQNIYNPGADYGSSNLNVPNVFSLSYIWNIPFFSSSTGVKRAALSGWKYSGVTTIQSGLSLDPGLNVSNKGLATRPDRLPAVNVEGPKTASQWFNTGAFRQPAFGFFGNFGVGIIRGPGLANFDMALYKNFPISERWGKMQFRSEFFNIFNHTNFAGVSAAFGSGNFGKVTSARDPRILEFALRWEF